MVYYRVKDCREKPAAWRGLATKSLAGGTPQKRFTKLIRGAYLLFPA